MGHLNLPKRIHELPKNNSEELVTPSWYHNLIQKYEQLDKEVENDIIESFLLFKRKSPN